MIIGREKPDLDSLAHFGVKGMRWGVRKAKVSDAQIIKARRQMDAYNTVSAVARRNVRLTKKGTKERAAAENKLNRIEMDRLRDPDRPTAMLMTRGEKWMSVIGGTIALPGVGTAAAVAAIGATNAASGRVAEKQKSGAYNKKK